MPELPEVEIIKSMLCKTILGKVIIDAKIYCDRLRCIIPKNFNQLITNTKILSCERRSRYLLIGLSNELSIIIHLGMSGKLLIKNNNNHLLINPIYREGFIEDPSDKIAPDTDNIEKLVNKPKKELNNQVNKHDRLIIELSNEQYVIFNDPRKFGKVSLVENNLISKTFCNLGVEPLSHDFTPGYLYSQLKNKVSPIKNKIMDNKIVVGVGNIYANESLFDSKIHPCKPAGQLSVNEIENLVYSIKTILQRAINCGGSSLKDFVDILGNKGYFQTNYLVYAQENKNCAICQNKIIRIRQAGRSTFLCEVCQSNRIKY